MRVRGETTPIETFETLKLKRFRVPISFFSFPLSGSIYVIRYSISDDKDLPSHVKKKKSGN